MHHPTKLLIYSFIIIFLIMLSLALITFKYNNGELESVSSSFSSQLEKISLIHELSNIVQNRTGFIQSLLIHDKGGINKESWTSYNQLTGRYKETLDRLFKILTAREKESMREVEKLNSEISTLSRQVTVLFLNGSKKEAGQILLREITPKTTRQMSYLEDISNDLQIQIKESLVESSSQTQNNQKQLTVYAIVSVLVSLAVAIFAVAYGRKLSVQLQDMNSYLEEKVYERTESLLDTQKELLEDNTELARRASTDSLTGLSNRSHMGEILHKEFSRFRRHQNRFGIIMLDIDHFKNVNDTYGHDVGDKVLVQLSQQLEQAIRHSDYISRWGGEEFLICCTTINHNDLLPIAETIRKLIFQSEFEAAGRITVSMGCAIIEPDEEVRELLKRADVALYAAKNNGRNQTVVSEFTAIS